MFGVGASILAGYGSTVTTFRSRSVVGVEYHVLVFGILLSATPVIIQLHPSSRDSGSHDVHRYYPNEPVHPAEDSFPPSRPLDVGPGDSGPDDGSSCDSSSCNVFPLTVTPAPVPVAPVTPSRRIQAQNPHNLCHRCYGVSNQG